MSLPRMGASADRVAGGLGLLLAVLLAACQSNPVAKGPELTSACPAGPVAGQAASAPASSPIPEVVAPAVVTVPARPMRPPGSAWPSAVARRGDSPTSA